MKLDIPAGDFDGYIFDCDGTLVDSMPAHYKGWVRAIEQLRAPYTLTEEQFYSWAGIAPQDIVNTLNQKHGVNLDPVAVEQAKEAAFLEELESVGVIEPVAQIAREQFGKTPLAIVSGGLEIVVRRSLEIHDLLKLFPVVVTPVDVARGKPAPDMFLLAAEKLGVAPERCLVFEDGQSGIDAAHAAGMQTVFVPSAPSP